MDNLDKFGVTNWQREELVNINGGSAKALGKWVGDRMCDIQAGLNAFYNYWGCGCYDPGC